jgi:hypothetical protein
VNLCFEFSDFITKVHRRKIFKYLS